MTVASKTDLLTLHYVRLGQPFITVTGNSSIQSNGIGFFTYLGNNFYGVSNTTTPVYPSVTGFTNVRLGQPFKDTIGNSSINASEFDYVRLGAPYYVPFTAPGPTYNTTQFFMVF